jgi:pimeloyl-ACP methyl ester carboxylesterase
LTQRYNLLLWDLWGYGDSDKDSPLPPAFSVHAQADVQQLLWRRLGVTRTHVVSHDLGDTVLQVSPVAGWLVH